VPQKPWIVEMGAAGNKAIVFIQWPGRVNNAERILSRISAAAFSVNVTATMHMGSTPRSSSSRYTSTSLRAFPVPALASTTVFISSGISLHTAGRAADNRTRRNPACLPGPGQAAHPGLCSTTFQSGSAPLQRQLYRARATQPDFLENEAEGTGLRCVRH